MGKGKGVGKSSTKNPSVSTVPVPLGQLTNSATELQESLVDKQSIKVDAVADQGSQEAFVIDLAKDKTADLTKEKPPKEVN